MINRLITFGDSFTEGEGAWLEKTVEIEKKYKDNPSEGCSIISEFNFKYSWPTQLAKLLQIKESYKVGNRTYDTKFLNAGSCGAANDYIFNNVFKKDSLLDFKEEDLIVVMWSSGIRNKIPFFPKSFTDSGPIGLGWSLNEVLSDYGSINFLKRYHKNEADIKYIDKVLSPFMKDYFKKYMTVCYDSAYYNLVNFNYIYFLQEFFKYKKCQYIFIDGFEEMNSFDSNNEKWGLVDKTKYWKFGASTAWDHLNKIGGDVFENTELAFSPPGQRNHPNRHGYKILGDLLYDFYKKSLSP